MEIHYTEELPPIDQYLELFESTGWNEKYQLSKEELALSVKSNFYSVAAYEGTKLVGFGRIISDGILHAMIYEMIVSIDYQGKGIGAAILRMLLKKCFDANIRDIQLFCAKGKREFYEKYEFQARPDDAPGMEYKGKR